MNYIVNANNVGVKFTKFGNIKRQELKRIVLNSLTGKNLNKKEFWALKNINFRLKAGEIVGIIGKNGAGKSTLCRVLSHIYRPDVGFVEIDGLVSALLSLGTGFNKELTGTENIYMNGMMLGFSFKEVEKVQQQIIDFADIGEFVDQPIKHYSKGMIARLGFSIAAMLEPEILILDETLNAGDEAFKIKASKKISELMSKAKLVVLVSHDLAFIEKHCSRVFWIDKGKLKDEGLSNHICEKYKNHSIKRKKKKYLSDNFSQTYSINSNRQAIKLDDVSLRYRINNNDFWALRNVSLTVGEGEILGIIGHNGAGKSTLCKILGKIMKPDFGHVEINGQTTEILGFGSGFNKELTGRDNILLNGQYLGIPRKKLESLYDEIVDFSELGEAIDDSLREYSNGMLSRLGFSIATSINPEILIIDEALSAGDYSFQEKAALKIQEMINSAKAVVVVTHNMNFVRNVCTRTVWMNKGFVFKVGDSNDIVEEYINYVIDK